MSHVVSIKTELTDLAAVKAACVELGLTFKENQKTIRWYGRWMNDYDAENAAYKLGIKPEQYGTCDHAIEVPGSNYDVGLLRNPATGGYRIYFDFYGTGRVIQEKLGQNGERILQHYAACKATTAAKKMGHMVHRTTKSDGTIQLCITGSSL